MTVAVCTLFEKDYHFGLAALVNSLARSGFAGRIFAGFRGPVPAWAAAAQPLRLNRWPDAVGLVLPNGCELVFLPLETSAHFTNIKPGFMLDLLADPDLQFDTLLYLDPDICVTAAWGLIEDWLTCGVALCEDVGSPLGEHHPRRVGWRRYFGERGAALSFRSPAYANGGCVGARREDAAFLVNWRTLMTLMGDAVGGLETAKIEGGGVFRERGFASCFDCTDQDALNAAVEMTGDVPFSILPQSAMGFARGAALLPHAIGARKPWRRRYLREWLEGVPPTAADKAFWECIEGPVAAMPARRVRSARRALRIASALSRIYRRQE